MVSFSAKKVHYGVIRQSSGLPSVVPFVPLGYSSRSFLPPFHSPLNRSIISSPEKGQLLPSLYRPRLHTVTSFVRRGYYVAVQLHYSSAPLHFHSAVLHHRPFFFQRLRLRRSVTPIKERLAADLIYTATPPSL